MSLRTDSHSNSLDKLSNKLCRTIFIGGIPIKSTTGDIEEYLSQFDEVESVLLPKNRLSGQLKGYARATLRTVEGVERLLSSPHHSIRGLNVGVSRWTTTDEYLVKKKDISSRKVYVKFKARIGVDNVLTYFSRFGPIEQFDVKRNPFTGRFRDFGYITFETESSAKAAISPSVHTISGEEVRCELSKPNQRKYEDSSAKVHFEEGKDYSNAPEGFFRKQLNNKLLSTKTDENAHDSQNNGLGNSYIHKMLETSSSKRYYEDAQSYEVQGGFDRELDCDSLSSPQEQHQLHDELKNEFEKYSKILKKEHGRNPQGSKANSSLDKDINFYTPTSRHYFKQNHENRQMNHYIPGNLQFKVKLPTLDEFGYQPLQQQP